MPGTNLKAKTSPCLTHTGCFVKQNPVSLHCFFFRKQWSDYLKMKSCTNLYKQHNLQHSLQYFHSKPSISPLSGTRDPLVPLLCTRSLAIPTSMPQWWGIAKVFQLVDHKTFFFPICISFDISHSQTALLKAWSCVSWSALRAPLRRLQAPRGKMERSRRRKGVLACCQTPKPLPPCTLPAALPPSKNALPLCSINSQVYLELWKCSGHNPELVYTAERQDPLWTEIKCS